MEHLGNLKECTYSNEEVGFVRVEGNTLNGTLRALEWRLRLMLRQLVNQHRFICSWEYGR